MKSFKSYRCKITKRLLLNSICFTKRKEVSIYKEIEIHHISLFASASTYIHDTRSMVDVCQNTHTHNYTYNARLMADMGHIYLLMGSWVGLMFWSLRYSSVIFLSLSIPRSFIPLSNDDVLQLFGFERSEIYG